MLIVMINFMHYLDWATDAQIKHYFQCVYEGASG